MSEGRGSKPTPGKAEAGARLRATLAKDYRVGRLIGQLIISTQINKKNVPYRSSVIRGCTAGGGGMEGGG